MGSKDMSVYTRLGRGEIEIQRLTKPAKIPTQGSEYAAGYDLYADNYSGNKSKDWTLQIIPGECVKIGTGIAVAIPQGYFGGIYARSGLACKAGLAPANKVGIIDSDYRGELLVCLYNQSPVPQRVQKGDRIAQFIIQPFIAVDWNEVDDLDNTDRGDGGFGSTGVN
jgi:dUTP pyrophosphatase